MGKRILGWLRQRRVAVMYGVLWCFSLGVIAVFFRKTLTAISHRADGEIAEACVLMYVTSVVLSAICCFLDCRFVGGGVVFVSRCNCWYLLYF